MKNARGLLECAYFTPIFLYYIMTHDYTSTRNILITAEKNNRKKYDVKNKKKIKNNVLDAVRPAAE